MYGVVVVLLIDYEVRQKICSGFVERNWQLNRTLNSTQGLSPSLENRFSKLEPVGSNMGCTVRPYRKIICVPSFKSL